MAAAFLAVDAAGSQVVLKIPLEPTALMVTRLENEARAGRRVRHPHVISTLDFFVDAGHPVLVIEYVDGCALKDLRTRGGFRNPMPPAAVAFLGRALADGLAAIHSAVDDAGRPLGMLHRDVTSMNVLIDRQGTPKLIDLGIARSAENEGDVTQVGMLKGTLRYLAPELLLGEAYAPTTDLWSLGVTLFEAALGRLMVSGEPVDIFRAITKGTYRQFRAGESLDPALEDALFALLAPKHERLQNARAAARMFASVEAKIAGSGTAVGQAPGVSLGQHVLAALVPFAHDIDDDDPATRPPAPTTPTPAPVFSQAPTAEQRGQRAGPRLEPRAEPRAEQRADERAEQRVEHKKVVIGGTNFGNAATLTLPAVNIAPPTAPVPAPVLPRMDVRPVSSSASSSSSTASTASTEAADGDVLPVGAATVQMPAWEPPLEWDEATERTSKS